MKRNLVTLYISSLISTSVFADSESVTSPYRVSQMDFGGAGLIQVPSGRMAEHGEFNFGGSWNSDYHHYSASIQLMEWAEATVRYTRVPDVLFNDNPEYSGDNKYTDKGIDFKIRLWDEGYWLPETSFGIRDFGGTGLFDAEYIAASKRFGSFDFTLGLGWGYLGQSGNVTNPFCKARDEYCTRPSDYKGSGGSVDYERWFKGPAAVFGGVEYYTPHSPLRLKVEYDSNDYTGDFVVKKGGEMPQDQRWNVGALYQIGDWADLKVSYQRGNTFTFGANIYTNFNHMSSTWLDEEEPIITRPYSSLTADNNSELMASQQEVSEKLDWQTVAQKIQKNAGYREATFTLEGDTLTVFAKQTKYRDRNEGLKRLAAILHNHAPMSVKTFKVVEATEGHILIETDINRQGYLFAANRLSIDAKVENSFDYYPHTQAKESQRDSDQVLVDTRSRWDYGFEPVLSQSLGGPESFYLYSLGLNARGSVRLRDNLELGGSIYFNLFDNYDKFNYYEDNPHIDNHATPRVRTMFRGYVHDNPVRLNRLQLTWFEQPSESVFTQAYVGYLEMMFAGVGGEILYRPMNSNWAVGIDANLVSQREIDSWFGVYDEDFFYYDNYNPNECANSPYKCQAYVLNKGTTGHLTVYYMPKWSLLNDTLFKVSAGQFLGGDVGTRIDFSKRFKSGVMVGAYATFTDLTAEEYGEGSYNKGFYISIPMDLITVKPSTQRARINWEPITRDGGQMLNRQYELFERTDARSPWFEKK